MPINPPLALHYTLVDEPRLNMFQDAEGSGPGLILDLFDPALGLHPWPELRRLKGEVVVGHDDFRGNAGLPDDHTEGRLELATAPQVTGPAAYKKKDPKHKKGRRFARSHSRSRSSASSGSAATSASSSSAPAPALAQPVPCQWVLTFVNIDPTVHVCVSVEVQLPGGEAPYNLVARRCAILVPSRHTVVLLDGPTSLPPGSIIRAKWYVVEFESKVEPSGREMYTWMPDTSEVLWHVEILLVRPGTFSNHDGAAMQQLPAAAAIVTGAGSQSVVTSGTGVSDADAMDVDMEGEGQIGQGGE